jgi:hypothetical protein
VEDHEQIVEHGHRVGSIDVENVDDENHREDEQCALPVFGFVVGIPNGYQALNDRSCEEGA